MEEMEKKMEDYSSKVSSTIVLDVGGKKFATSKSTLLSHPDTFFSSLLRSGDFKVCSLY